MGDTQVAGPYCWRGHNGAVCLGGDGVEVVVVERHGTKHRAEISSRTTDMLGRVPVRMVGSMK